MKAFLWSAREGRVWFCLFSYVKNKKWDLPLLIPYKKIRRQYEF
jgi:hypothetical protein